MNTAQPSAQTNRCAYGITRVGVVSPVGRRLLIANALVDQDTTTRTRSKTWDRRAERIFSTLSPAVRFGQ
jgi:hypothetical protein